MDFQTLYDFTYSLTKLYDEATDRNILVNGFKQALSLFFPIEEIKIYLIDEYSYLLKTGLKPLFFPEPPLLQLLLWLQLFFHGHHQSFLRGYSGPAGGDPCILRRMAADCVFCHRVCGAVRFSDELSEKAQPGSQMFPFLRGRFEKEGRAHGSGGGYA